MANPRKVIMLDTTASSIVRHRPMETGADCISGELVQLSTDANNIVTTGSDGGLLVTAQSVADPTALISGDGGNIITTGTDDKLFARAPNPATFISVDGGNSLITGTDGKLFNPVVQSGTLLSNDSGNQSRRGTDGGIFTPATSAASLVSADSDNSLGVGTDGKLYSVKVTPTNIISTDGSNDLTVDGSGKLSINVNNALKISAGDHLLTKAADGLVGDVTLRYDSSTGLLELLGKSNTVIGTAALAVGQLLKSATVVENPAGQPAGTYIEMVFATTGADQTVYINVSSLIINYTAANASIVVTGTTLSAGVDSAAGLTINANGITAASGRSLMTAAQVTKLDGIAAGAQVNTVTSVAGRTGAVVLSKTDVGLANVDNTTDLSKPISTATQTALDGKAATNHTTPYATTAASGHVRIGTGLAINATNGVTSVTYGVAAGTAVEGNDARLTNARTPTAHAATHVMGGSDPLSVQAIGKLGGEDLNDYWDAAHAGWWSFNGGTPPLNTPIASTQIFLNVVPMASVSSTERVLQRAFSMQHNGRIWERTRTSSGVWTEWTRTDGMLKVGGGLTRDNFGILIDTSQVFLLISLNSNRTVYVRTTGSDSNDGSDVANAFASIQAAINYISNHYSLGIYTVTVDVGEGTFGNFTLPKYNASTGRIVIRGAGKALTLVTGAATSGVASIVGAGTYVIEDISVTVVQPVSPTAGYRGLTAATGVSVIINNTTWDVTEAADNGNFVLYGLTTDAGGSITIGSGNIVNVHGKAGTVNTYILNSTGTITINADLETNGNVAVNAQAINLGVIVRNQQTNPVVTGAVTGARYRVTGNGVIRVNGAGDTYFPGTSLITPNTGGQYY